MKKLPPKICPLPWISMETTPMGGCRPCCLAKEEVFGIDLRENTMEEAYKSYYMKDLRQQFLNGEKPQTCSRCWEEEAAGKMSKRMNTQVRLKHLMDKVDYENTEPDQLWFLDLKLGNVCNLKCRICGSWSSSKWAQEEMRRDGGGKEHLAYTHLKKGAWPKDNDQFWYNLYHLMGNVQYMEFTGGEPFMIEEHLKLLDHCVSTGHAANIELHYNTNGTQDVPWWRLRHFKKVEVAFSIDNVGERFEYERYGASWEDVDNKNILKKDMGNEPDSQWAGMIKAKFPRQLCFTINIQNVYYLDQLLLWAKTKEFDSIHWNYLHDPWHMNVQYMTPECKEFVLAAIENNHKIVLPEYTKEWNELKRYIENGPGSDGKIFCQYMKKTDLMRNQNFGAVYPEIAEKMGYV